ncbi:MAG TPA: cytochrome c oxidase assembly protein [Candidatus Polarisedimenticolia bacterium]|nr:cytochrome c oxidase assembly protein [Candidatus Polarisedimenticolia bacterium]
MHFQTGVRRLAAPLVAGLLALLQPAVAAAHGAVPAEPPSVVNMAFGWTIEPFIALPLLAVAVVWLRLVRRVNAAHPATRVPRIRSLAFLGGLAVIAVALMSGIGRYDTALFSVHMVQHLLLTLVAAPLLVLSAPVTLLLRAASAATRRRWLLPMLHSRLLRVVGHPVVAWLAFAGVMWGSHFSALFNAALEEPLVHDLEHGLFLAAGLLFWWPVVGLDPSPHRMSHPARVLYAFLQMPQNSFLAVAILFAETPLYAHYATLGSPWGITALADQDLAAGIMWLVGDVLFLGAVVGLIAAWMRHEGRTTAASDRRSDLARVGIREREAALRARRDAESAAGSASGDR